MNRPINPPAARARARERPPVDGRLGGGGIGEYFAALGEAWRLTDDQRARLGPAVDAALRAGWTPASLAGFTGSNTEGVRSPYAVLITRLSAAELPPAAAPVSRLSRPPWCGECDQRTRILGFDGDAPRPCPRCKPTHGSFQHAAVDLLRPMHVPQMRNIEFGRIGADLASSSDE